MKIYLYGCAPMREVESLNPDSLSLLMGCAPMRALESEKFAGFVLARVAAINRVLKGARFSGLIFLSPGGKQPGLSKNYMF